MATTNRERVLNYLRSIAPRGATNAQISEATGVTPHQQVYIKSRELMEDGLIQGQRDGRTWLFYASEPGLERRMASKPSKPKKEAVPGGKLTPRDFEALARMVMTLHYGKQLNPGQATGVPKRFDFVSADKKVIGDAKYYTLVQGKRLPPAKFSIIAEHVWLLEKSNSRYRFLVFGNDIRVPKQWLARYGSLVTNVAFYFLDDNGWLMQLA